MPEGIAQHGNRQGHLDPAIPRVARDEKGRSAHERETCDVPGEELGHADADVEHTRRPVTEPASCEVLFREMDRIGCGEEQGREAGVAEFDIGTRADAFPRRWPFRLTGHL